MANILPKFQVKFEILMKNFRENIQKFIQTLEKLQRIIENLMKVKIL